MINQFNLLKKLQRDLIKLVMNLSSVYLKASNSFTINKRMLILSILLKKKLFFAIISGKSEI